MVTITTESTATNEIHTKAEGVQVFKISADQPVELEEAVEAFRLANGDFRGIVSYIEEDPNITRQARGGGDTIVSQGARRHCTELVSRVDVDAGKV